MSPLLEKIYQELQITEKHISNYRIPRCEQPLLSELEVVDIDFEGKPFILEKATAGSWKKMREAAQADKILLEPFSGFRSYVYQKQLITRKLDKGRPLDVILTETAIPGFSEHHTGRAIDICTNQKYVLDESFEKTEAFSWLMTNASRFNFRLSYPRGNTLGIIYEPWHWYYSRH